MVVARRGERGGDGWRGAMRDDKGWEEAVSLGFWVFLVEG